MVGLTGIGSHFHQGGTWCMEMYYSFGKAVSLSPSLAAKYPAPTDCALCTHVLNVCGIDFTEHKESFSNAS